MRYWMLFGTGILGCNGSDKSLNVNIAPPTVSIQQPTDGAELQQGDALQLRGFIQDPYYEDDLTQIQVSWAVGGTTVCEEATIDLGGNSTCDYVFADAGEVSIDLQATSPSGTNSVSNTVTVVTNFPPEAEIITPNGTINYYSDHLISFDGIISDVETAVTDLSGQWTSSIDGELDISGTPDQDGHIQGEELLSEGTHTIVLTATESDTRQGSDTITIEVGSMNILPDCGIINPIAGDTFGTGEIIEFSGEASDPDIPSSELTAEWSSNLDGALSQTPVNSDGTFSIGIDSLSNGPHTISLTVLDEVGGSCTDSVELIISSRPLVQIIEPIANEIFNENARVDFQAQVSDVQDPPQDLLISWSSSIDGIFSSQSATSNGTAIANTYLLTPGTHNIELTASDTDGYSSTDQVTIQINALPTTPVISLNPNPSTSSDDLSVNLDVPSVDPEGDTITYSYQWTKNTQPTTHSSSSIPFSDTTRGDVWEVYVTPNDGYGDGTMVTESTTIINSAPLISAATLSLSSLLETDSLSCFPIGEYDEDGDTISFTYEWLVNGSSVSSNPTIDGSLFNRGDTVQCQITPSDGNANGTGVTISSTILTVANSLPAYVAAELSPTTAYEADTMTCLEITPSDADGDSVSPIYAWDINGVTITPISNTLTGSFFDKGDAVTCHTTPNDGTDSGTMQNSNTVIISNTAPVLGIVDLTPLTSYESSTLACTPQSGTYSDDDGDSISFSYDWLIDGSPIGVNADNLDGVYFDKHETVSCIATPNDGTIDGIAITSNEIAINNTVPTITSATLSSPTNDVTSELTCTSGSTNDIDPADSVTVSYAWTIGGSTLSGQTNNTLPSSEILRGDVVTCIITPNDGEENGIPAISNSITIINTAPAYSGAELTPNPAYEADTLNCSGLNPSDDDGDSVTPTYAWYVGSGSIGISTSTLTGAYFNKGDAVYCTVTPSDGLTSGATVTSNAINVLNTAPVLGIVDLTPLTSYESSTLACTPQSGTYSDDDSDSISFSYDWLIDGSPIGINANNIDGASFNKNQTVACIATPNDGTVDGISITSNVININNTIPTISSATLSSPTSDVTSAMTCTAGSTNDIDPADSITVSYAWTKNGTTISGQTNSTLQPSSFASGDSIICLVTPNDGTDNGIPASSNEISLGNAIPSYTNPSLSPATSYEASTLTCTLGSASDPDGDVVSPIYAWVKNGSALLGITSSTLTGSYFNKGDILYCSVTPDDGTDTGLSVSSNSVTIQNSAPTANTPSISPTTAYEASTFACADAGGSDVDPVDSVSFTYGWKVNGQTIGQTGTSLTGSSFDKGDIVKCFVIPSDGFNSGSGVDSIGVTVSNSTPTFSSIVISPSNPTTAESIGSSASGWSDDDGDNEGYTYQWYDQSGAISGATGASLSSSATDKGDIIFLQAVAYDGVDTGTIRSSNSLTVVNSAPEAPQIEVQPTDAEPEDNLSCVVTVGSYDADGDSVTYSYQWYLNGLQQVSLTTNTVGSANTAHNDLWTCLVIPHDGTVTGASVSDSQVVADITSPDAPILNAIDLYRNDGTINITGSGDEAGSVITLFKDCDSGLTTSTTTVGNTLVFNLTITIASGDSCTYYATATDQVGNTSGNSNDISSEFCDPVDSYELSSSFDGNSCSGSIDVLSILAPSSNATAEMITGNIIIPGDEDWYVVDSSQTTLGSGINYYNLQVNIISGSPVYDIAVYRADCTVGALQTGSAGETSYDSYNYFAKDIGDGAHSIPSETRYCSSSSASYNVCDDLSQTYYIKVTREDGVVDCQEYTLSIQNGYPSTAP